MLKQANSCALPELAHEAPTTEIFLNLVSDVLQFRTNVAEIVRQLDDGLPHFETDEDYLRLEILGIRARQMREEKTLDALKENPLYAGLMEIEI